MRAWDIPGKKTARPGAWDRTRVSPGDQLTGKSEWAQNSLLGASALDVGGSEGDGTPGSHWLLFGPCPYVPLPPLPNVLVTVSAPLSLSLLCLHRGGLLLDPSQAILGFSCLGNPPYSY